MPNSIHRVCKLFLAAALLTACGDDGGTGPEPETRLFDRYVALGNSITAGFKSGGINDSTQAHSYAVLLAQRFNAPFAVARLQRPGCPPPLVGPFLLTRERVAGASAISCAGFVQPIPQPVQSLAFPGFKIADALAVPGGLTGTVYQQVLGNRSLVQAMIEAKPSLVSVWLGNNDALTAATAGDLGFLTPLASFESSLDQIVSAIANQTAAQDAVLLGVTDPQLAPIVQPGVYFWALAQDPVTRELLPKPVSDTCAPLTPTGQANPGAANLVSLRVLDDAAVAEVSCAETAAYVLNAAEQQTLSGRAQAFNAAIRSRAQARGWIYLDADALTRAQLVDPNRIRKCQGVVQASTPEQFRAAILNTCPHPNAPNFFGSLVSYDAVHPSLAGQKIVADAIEAALRAKHGTL